MVVSSYQKLIHSCGYGAKINKCQKREEMSIKPKSNICQRFMSSLRLNRSILALVPSWLWHLNSLIITQTINVNFSYRCFSDKIRNWISMLQNFHSKILLMLKNRKAILTENFTNHSSDSMIKAVTFEQESHGNTLEKTLQLWNGILFLRLRNNNISWYWRFLRYIMYCSTLIHILSNGPLILYWLMYVMVQLLGVKYPTQIREWKWYTRQITQRPIGLDEASIIMQINCHQTIHIFAGTSIFILLHGSLNVVVVNICPRAKVRVEPCVNFLFDKLLVIV